jgi:dihydroflavonol-4-reductase
VNFVDVEDVARGHILAAKKGRMGERYILGNENLSIKDFFDLIAQVGGVEPPKRKTSYPMAITLAYVSKLVSIITRKPPLVPISMARNIGLYAYYDCSKAVRELGFPQPPIKTAIEKAVNWFKENGYVKGV